MFVETKPAMMSKAVVGNAASLTSVIAAIIVAKTKLPPELVNIYVMPLLVAGFGNILGLIGRLFADTKISGIFR